MSEGRDRRHRLLQRLVIAAACWSLAAGAQAQVADQGGDAGGTGGASAGGDAATSLPPAPPGSLLQSGPPQVGGLGGGSPLPTTAGSTMRDRIDSALGLQAQTAPGQPAIQVVPAISLQQGWTSNVYGGYAGVGAPSSGQSAFMTVIAPSVTASFDTQRLLGSLSYSPNLTMFEPSYGLNTVAQNMSVNLTGTLVPEHLFVTLSGFAGMQTIAGGYGPTGTIPQNSMNSAQDYGFSIAPYYQQRIGSFGTLEVGGSVGETAQIIPGTAIVAPTPGFPGAVLPSQNATMTEEHIVFTSGDAFGRWLSNAYASFSQMNGTGVFTSGYSNTVAYEGGYAVTRQVIAIATIGWNDLSYSGFPPVRIEAPLWNVGMQFTPNPDSQITVRYGETDGVYAPYVSAYYQVTPRTRIIASYSSQLSTDQQQLNGDLAFATTDSMGNLVNSATGQSLLATNNFMGIYSGVYVLTMGSISAMLLLDRDIVTVGFNHQEQRALNSGVANFQVFNSNGNFGFVSWQHDLSEDVTAGASLQYGVYQTSAPVGPTSATFSESLTSLTGSAQISYAISKTLQVSLSYSYTNDGGYGTLPGFSVSTVMAGISKTF